MTTPQIKKELLKNNVIILSLRKYKKNGYIAIYSIRLTETCVSVEKEIWIEEKEDLFEIFN